MARVGIIAFMLVLCLSSVMAAKFDYAQNPPASDLSGYTASYNQVLHDSSTMKEGYLTIMINMGTTPCPGSVMDGNGQSFNYPYANTKGLSQCGSDRDVRVSVDTDNQNYYATAYAKIGDTVGNNFDYSVTPYNYNIWVSKDYPLSSVNDIQSVVDKNDPMIDQVSWKDTSGNQYLSARNGYPQSVGIPWDTYINYEYFDNNKRGVCNDQINTALANKGSYFTNPNDLIVSGFGTVTNNNCLVLMFPELNNNAGGISTNSLYLEQPNVINSLMYDNKFQFTGNPFNVYQIELNCFSNNGALLNTKTGYDTSLDMRCASNTRYATVSVTLQKNQYYRHLSPVDWTYHYSDIFNKKVSLIANMSSSVTDAVYYTYTKTYHFNDYGPGNNTFVNGTSLSSNNGTVSTHTDTDSNIGSINDTNTTVSGSPKKEDCPSCTQNISVGNQSLLPGTGTSSGGNTISQGTDDSAVGTYGNGKCEGLSCQAQGQNDAAIKASFIDKLILIALSVLAIVVILYSVFALLLLLMFYVSLFNIPKKMADSLKKLFDAGARR